MFTLKFKTENDPFANDDAELEVKRILEGVVNNVYVGHREGLLFDINGNKVGSWKYT